jgi:dTDP-4-amino-4,6-dideoxygalactose transaminase
MIPFLDLKRSYNHIANELKVAVAEVMDSQQFILGDAVENFERDFAYECWVDYAVGVASCSDALALALMALGVGKGDEVITTPFTFVATAEAIVRVGATPVFADIDPRTYNLDPTAFAEAITPKTVAVIPVHLYGQCADMQRINGIAQDRGIAVVEDAAQAFGATQEARFAGNLGTIGCHSFFPTKNLGGFGDGGMITTSDGSLYRTLRTLRAHGASRKYHYATLGMNSRLDAIQAKILNVKLKYVPENIRTRRFNAQAYDQLLEELMQISTPFADERNFHTYNQYTISVPKRHVFEQAFKQLGIGYAVYYPLPLHLQPCFEYLGYKRGNFPVAEYAAEHVLSLPIFPGLELDEQVQVVDAIKETIRINALW